MWSGGGQGRVGFGRVWGWWLAPLEPYLELSEVHWSGRGSGVEAGRRHKVEGGWRRGKRADLVNKWHYFLRRDRGRGVRKLVLGKPKETPRRTSPALKEVSALRQLRLQPELGEIDPDWSAPASVGCAETFRADRAN